MSDLGSGLVTGPSDGRYTSILMGVRGSGKTVTLNEIEDRASADGWVVLSMDAGTPGLLKRIMRAIAQAEQTYEALGLDGSGNSRSIEKSVGIRLGPLEGKLSTTEFYGQGARMGLREHLAFLVQAALKHQTSVLLTVDEMHGIDRAEGRRLSNDLQHITKRAEMPLAFIGAGLLEMRRTLMQDRKMTFFHRCEHYEMPPLEVDDAIVGLSAPIANAGGEITDDALRLASRSVGGSPYKLQVIGDRAWEIAGAPDETIDTRAVKAAVCAAEEIVDKRISVPAWHDLSEGEKSILASVARRGGEATPRDVAKEARMDSKYVSGVLGVLKDSGYVDRPSTGTYRLTELVPKGVVLRESQHLEGHDALDDPIVASSQSAKCRKWMPRAKAYCILKQGHAGGCRSN